MTKTPEKPYPFGAAHTHIAHIREYPPTLPEKLGVGVRPKPSPYLRPKSAIFPTLFMT